MADDFIPGAYWTPENAHAAVSRMVERLNSPEMLAFMHEMGAAGEAGDDPAALAAARSATEAHATRRGGFISADACRYRRGRAADIPDFVRLIVAGDLPPLFIEEFVEGFVAVEHEDEIVGCGGLEIYDRYGVIRSVVVDERGRGQHIGERIADLLIADARVAGVTDVCLMTMQAHPFWLRYGFVDTPLAEWPEPTYASWQYQFGARFPGAMSGVYPMRLSVT